MTNNDERPYGMAWNNEEPTNSYRVTYDNPPPDDPPPKDPPPDNPPPKDPPPKDPPKEDAQATIARLQGELAAATNDTKAFDTTKAALRDANPHLPDAVFDAPDLDALTANVQAHRATAEHIRTHPAPTNVNPAGGGTRVPDPIPSHVRGAARIAKALARQEPGG